MDSWQTWAGFLLPSSPGSSTGRAAWDVLVPGRVASEWKGRWVPPCRAGAKVQPLAQGRDWEEHWLLKSSVPQRANSVPVHWPGGSSRLHMPFHTATVGMAPLPVPGSLSTIATFCPLGLKLPSPQGLCFRHWGMFVASLLWSIFWFSFETADLSLALLSVPHAAAVTLAKLTHTGSCSSVGWGDAAVRRMEGLMCWVRLSVAELQPHSRRTGPSWP